MAGAKNVFMGDLSLWQATHDVTARCNWGDVSCAWSLPKPGDALNSGAAQVATKCGIRMALGDELRRQREKGLIISYGALANPLQLNIRRRKQLKTPKRNKTQKNSAKFYPVLYGDTTITGPNFQI